MASCWSCNTLWPVSFVHDLFQLLCATPGPGSSPSAPPETRLRSPSSVLLGSPLFRRPAARGRRRLAKPGRGARHQIRTLLVSPGPIPRLSSHSPPERSHPVPILSSIVSSSSSGISCYLFGLKILVSYVSQLPRWLRFAFLVHVLVLG